MPSPAWDGTCCFIYLLLCCVYKKNCGFPPCFVSFSFLFVCFLFVFCTLYLHWFLSRSLVFRYELLILYVVNATVGCSLSGWPRGVGCCHVESTVTCIHPESCRAGKRCTWHQFVRESSLLLWSSILFVLETSNKMGVKSLPWRHEPI